MKLLKLRIKNFKGIDYQEIEPNGKSFKIFGKNALKKTSTADAGNYILTDMDSQDRSTRVFGIKPREINEDGTLGDEIIGAEPEVEASYELDDGSTITFKKAYTENWVKSRGKANEELRGATVKYWIDDSPVSAGDYQDRVDSIIEKDLLKMLTNPMHIAENMTKDERRNLLISLITITDKEVVDSDPALEGYLDLLDGKTQSAVEGRLKERKKELNDELGTRRNPGNISARIDENDQKIVEVEEPYEVAEASIGNLKDDLSEKQERLSEVKSGGAVADLNVRVQEIEAKKAKLKNEHNAEAEEELKDYRQKVTDLQSKRDTCAKEFNEAKKKYVDQRAVVDGLVSEIQTKEKAIDKIRSEEPPAKPSAEDEKCDKCGTVLEEKDQAVIDEQYEETLQDFNADKARRGKELKEEIEALESKLTQEQSTLDTLEGNGAKKKSALNQVDAAIEKAEHKLEVAKAEQSAVSETEEYKALVDEANDLLEKVRDEKSARKEAIDGVEAEIKSIENEIEFFQKMISTHNSNDQCRKRIEELRAQKKRFGKELIEVENGLNLIEDFNRRKAELITDKVNLKFNLVNWRLFREQNNGGLEERCDPVYNSNPWDDLSTSEKIKCGLDIINTLSEHFGKSAPVWVDNRESVTELPDNDLQTCSLVVSPSDSTLRFETGESIEVMEEELVAAE